MYSLSFPYAFAYVYGIAPTLDLVNVRPQFSPNRENPTFDALIVHRFILLIENFEYNYFSMFDPVRLFQFSQIIMSRKYNRMRRGQSLAQVYSLKRRKKWNENRNHNTNKRPYMAKRYRSHDLKSILNSMCAFVLILMLVRVMRMSVFAKSQSKYPENSSIYLFTSIGDVCMWVWVTVYCWRKIQHSPTHRFADKS